MGVYLFFVNQVQPDGEPAEGAKWLDTHVKTSYTYQYEEKAAQHGLKFDYPKNGAPATVMQLAIFAKYLHLLRDLYGRHAHGLDDNFFEPDAMSDFLAKHGKKIETGQWYWHQG